MGNRVRNVILWSIVAYLGMTIKWNFPALAGHVYFKSDPFVRTARMKCAMDASRLELEQPVEVIDFQMKTVRF